MNAKIQILGIMLTIQTPYACGENIRAVILELQSLAFRFFKLFQDNHVKTNPEKSHILLNNKKQKR